VGSDHGDPQEPLIGTTRCVWGALTRFPLQKSWVESD
jgi:hypothetical protein